MFYLSYTSFWLVTIIYPLSFGDQIYDSVLLYGELVQKSCLLISLSIYVSLPTKRVKSCLMLMFIYSLFSHIASIIAYEITAIYYTIESLLFFSWAIWLMLRPEISTAKTINKNNILLAFYKGEKGSFIMNFFELFGLPVKSMCILAGDKALYLKTNDPNFVFGASEIITRHADDYILIDTGVRVTTDFIIEMKKHTKLVATKGIFRVRCIEAVSDLLGMIGDEWKPRSCIPSLYLKQVKGI